MPIPKSDKIWINGAFVDWDDARIHVLSHVIHYGSSVFEGMRCYETPQGSVCFRLMDHVNRLYDSAKIYRMPIPYTRDELYQVCSRHAPTTLVGDAVAPRDAMMAFREGDRAGRTV